MTLNNFTTAKMASNYSINITTLNNNNESSAINFSAVCPIYTDSDRSWKETVAFWLDGVIKTILACVGILMNMLAAYILGQNHL